MADAGACLVSNTSIEPLTLPAPLYGVIAPGRSIVMNFTVAQLVAAAPSLAQGAHLTDLPSTYAGSYDAGYGILGGTTGGSFNGNLLPGVSNAYDVGSETALWGTGFYGGMVCGTYRWFSSPGVPEYNAGINLAPVAGATTGLAAVPGINTLEISPTGGTNPNLVLRATDAGKLRLANHTGATILAIEAAGASEGLAAEFTAPAYSATPTANTMTGLIEFHAADVTITVSCNRLAANGNVLAMVQGADATLKSVTPVVTGAGTFTLTGNAAATGTVRVFFIVINRAS